VSVLSVPLQVYLTEQVAARLKRRTISGLRPPLVLTSPRPPLPLTAISVAAFQNPESRLRRRTISGLRPPIVSTFTSAPVENQLRVRVKLAPRISPRRTIIGLRPPLVLIPIVVPSTDVILIPLRVWITEPGSSRPTIRKTHSKLSPPVLITIPTPQPPIGQLRVYLATPVGTRRRRRVRSSLGRPRVVTARQPVLVPIRVRLAEQVAIRRRRRGPHSVLRPPITVSPFVPPPPPPPFQDQCTAGPLPYLNVGGVEVSNAARTLEYLSAGLGSAKWNTSGCTSCSVLSRLDSDDCTPTTFVSPVADPAPWYDAAQPGASSFLGVVLLDFTGYDSTVTREITPKIQGLGGAAFSGQRRNPRTWKFRAALVSADDTGAEFGLRWLTKTLQASACDTCPTSNLTVRLVCPPEDCSDDTLGEWISYDVALTEGPMEVEKWSPGGGQDALYGCRDFVIVEWTMVAGNPFLYKRPEVCLPAEIIGENAECDDICDFLFGSPGEAHCCSVTPPTRGTLGAIFTLQSVSGMNSVLLGAYATCPTGSEDNPVWEIELSGVPAGGTVVVDSARHTVTVTQPDGEGGLMTSDAQSLLVLEDRPLEWIEARSCDDITCFCARTAHPCSQGGDTLVSISTQLREG
jgi:hypothetical protein